MLSKLCGYFDVNAEETVCVYSDVNPESTVYLLCFSCDVNAEFSVCTVYLLCVYFMCL